MATVNVLFVCMGNICRSPVAEGVFRHQVEQAGLEAAIWIDSAGTHAYHIGQPPDPRSRATAMRRDVDISNLRARKVIAHDFRHFDYMLAMDKDNLHDLQQNCPDPLLRDKIRLFLDFAPQLSEREVPDPYYGGVDGFDHVMDLAEAAAAGLLEDIRTRYRFKKRRGH